MPRPNALLGATLLPALLAAPGPGGSGEPAAGLTRERASTFAKLALKGLRQEYPNKPEHVIAGPGVMNTARLGVK